MKQKNVILGLVILILIGGFAYWQMFSTTEEDNLVNTNQLEEWGDTSDWINYRSETYGLIFKHPYDVDVEEGDSMIHITANLPWPERGTSLLIREVEQSVDELIGDYNKSDVLSDGTALATIFEQEEYLIGGVEANMLKGSTAIGIDRNIIFVTNNDRNYTISFMHTAIDEEMQIIDSFKFID